MDQERQTRRFHDLVWPHRADVLRVAQFLCRDRPTAEDLAQETLLKSFRALNRFRDGTNVKAWLLQILRNTWLDQSRMAGSRIAEVSFRELPGEPQTQHQTGVPAAWGDPHAVLEGFSDERVIEALQAIPEEMRWTLLLVDVQGLTLEEAGQVLEVPTGTIKSRAHRGRQMLHEKLLPLARELRLVPDATNKETSQTEER